MEIVVNVDGAKFDEILKKELEAFSKEELHELCRQGIANCLKDSEALKELFTRKSQGYYDQYQANEILKDAAKTVDFSSLYKEIQDSIINYVKENHEELIKTIVMESFLNGLSQSICNNNDFTWRIKNEIYQTMNHPNN